jgi:hypothetical protein
MKLIIEKGTQAYLPSASEAKGQNKLELFVPCSLSSLIFASKAGAYPGGAFYSARLST